MKVSGENENFVGFYWGPRKEERDAVAVSLFRLLGVTNSLFPEIQTWTDRRASGRAKSMKIGLQEDLIRSVLHENRTDVGKYPIESLGLSFSLFSRIDAGTYVSLAGTIGAYDETSSNFVVLEFEGKFQPATKALRELLAEGVTLLSPENAIVTSLEDLRVTFPNKPWLAEASARFSSEVGFEYF